MAGKRKHFWFTRRVPATCGSTTSVEHQSLSLHRHLHLLQPFLPTGSSLFCGGRGQKEQADAEEGQKCDGGRKEKWNSGFHQEKTAEEEKRATVGRPFVLPVGWIVTSKWQQKPQQPCNYDCVREFLLHTFTMSSGADVPHVEVDDVLRICPLDGDGKGFERVEGEGNKASHRVIYRPSQQTRLDLELQQA